ncbi:rubrerythrin-like domain-containing protein [Halorarius halobius]|nr:rubrerythrin-like domain-containing protein [Halorarius halobius]
MHYRECLGCGARYLMGSAGGDCPKCGGALQNISLSRE